MPASRALRAVCDRAYVVAHMEDVQQLRGVLEADGLRVEEVRGPYTTEQLRYSLQMRCLVNHANAWKAVAKETKPAIVVEADFVPVRRFGNLPLPFPYFGKGDEARFGWLYSGGSILYGFDQHGYPHGHGNTTVAYVLTPVAAQQLLRFFEREVAADSTGGYRMWETYLGIFLRKEVDILNHIPIYQYGEHGGIPNREHRAAGVRSWHQADMLWAGLAFLPNYAEGRTIRYRVIRTRGWARGIARLIALRFFDPRYVNADSTLGRAAMAKLAIARMFHAAGHYVRLLDGLKQKPPAAG